MKTLTLAVVASVLMCGCAADPPPTTTLSDIESRCEDPRPQMCTREYRPVCGLRDTGIRCVTTPCPSTEWKTYGNACDACADADVIGHLPGACED